MTGFQDTPSRVLFEDNHLLAFNKRPSEIVQGDKTGDTPLVDILKDYIKKKYNKPGAVFLGVVHRIDRPVSGVVLFARTGKALARLNDMLKEGQISKIYWAIVKNKPPKDHDHLVHYLKRNQEKNKSFAYDIPKPGTQRAELIYQLIGTSDRYYFLEVELLTGRHHQIRAQLAAIGCPIRGDIKYGYPRTNEDGSIHLHARAMAFMHPVRKEMIRVVAEPPGDALWKAFTILQRRIVI